MTIRTGYAVLAAVLVGSVVVVLRTPENSLWSGFFLNVAAGVVGTFLTVLLIDNVLERQAAEREAKMVRVALAQLKIPIADHARFWTNLFKSAATKRPDPLPSEIDQFLQPLFIDSPTRRSRNQELMGAASKKPRDC